MKIGVDLDGVCADFNDGWQNHYFNWFGRCVDSRHADEWNAPLEASHFETEEEFWGWIDLIPGFWSGLDVIPGALGTLMGLHAAGHRMVAVTSRHEKTKQQTYLWLKTNGFLAFVDGVQHLHKSAKHEAGCDVYIDDNPVVLRHLREQGIETIRFERPWNYGTKATAVARSWADVPRLVTAMASGRTDEEG